MLTGGVSEKGDDAEEKELSCSNSTDENAEKELTTYCAPKTNWQSFFFFSVYVHPHDQNLLPRRKTMENINNCRFCNLIDNKNATL